MVYIVNYSYHRFYAYFLEHPNRVLKSKTLEKIFVQKIISKTLLHCWSKAKTIHLISEMHEGECRIHEGWIVLDYGIQIIFQDYLWPTLVWEAKGIIETWNSKSTTYTLKKSWQKHIKVALSNPLCNSMSFPLSKITHDATIVFAYMHCVLVQKPKHTITDNGRQLTGGFYNDVWVTKDKLPLLIVL